MTQPSRWTALMLCHSASALLTTSVACCWEVLAINQALKCRICFLPTVTPSTGSTPCTVRYVASQHCVASTAGHYIAWVQDCRTTLGCIDVWLSCIDSIDNWHATSKIPYFSNYIQEIMCWYGIANLVFLGHGWTSCQKSMPAESQNQFKPMVKNEWNLHCYKALLWLIDQRWAWAAA
jgi:hypothetical protein